MTGGFDVRLRSLLVCKVAIWPADWARLAEELGQARGRGADRADFAEAFLQAILFYGFPRAVSAFEILQRDWPVDTAPSGGSLPREDQARAGRELFDSIYGKNHAAVHALLRSFHAEFHDFVLEAAYGRILTRPGLVPRERELLATAALAVMRQIPQLLAHSRGALRFGATEAELREALRIGGIDGAEARALILRIQGV